MPSRPFKRTNASDPFNPSGAGRRLPGAPAPKAAKAGPLGVARSWKALRKPKASSGSSATPAKRLDVYTRKVL